ncbi:MAG TPA: fluoride efflux transporter CrcB [Nitrospirae bacterium]|nr:putative fluoride ion transporter CrcB [bacterium BMS3Abin09]GBE40499.1 putative fluoride ion transporter CrcB [bacterium BMS3Bbin09]HDN95113.1 fluoride efflux transporter CrcB [Nitrospirota bacterium]HDO67382.1 fluoride efflux transporter CrcB [Nitrospirota bacterium]HDZ84553.1 fluoride efflux transporter CrcB [Nitrospirota bacterium]
MIKIILLAAGGAIGTLLRYSMSGTAQRAVNSMFPWGTLAVNLAGSFFIGLLWGIFEVQNISSNFRTFLFVGILGGFTTFSTFALESLNLMRDGEMKLALSNVLVSNILGILLVFTGFMASKYIINLIR